MKAFGTAFLAGCLVFAGSEAPAATTFGGAGPAHFELTSQGRTISCSAPLSARLVISSAGFVLTHQVGPGSGSAPACASDGVVQGTHMASDLTPPAHRCFISGGGGGVGISASPYSLAVSGATYIASRIDSVACSAREYVVDRISLTAGDSSVVYTREMTLGPLGAPRFALSVQATLTRLDVPELG